MALRYLLLFLGVGACFRLRGVHRMSATDPLVLTALRLVFASFMLAPVLLMELRATAAPSRGRTCARARPRARARALILWTLGARMTAVAQATLIVNLVPIALPFFLLWLARERINAAEVAGTALAIVGLATLSARDAVAGGGSAAGDAVASPGCSCSPSTWPSAGATGTSPRSGST